MTPKILIDDDVLALLKSNAEPFVDTPNTVLRRLLGLPETNGHVPGAELVGEAEEALNVATTKQSGQRRRRRRRPTTKRAQPGTILADEEYEIPLLATLDAHGGRAPTSEVLDELAQRLAHRLMPADHEPLD